MRALVDPEIEPLIDALPLIDLTPATLAEARDRSRVDSRLFDRRMEPKHVQISAPGDRTVPALLFDPPGATEPRGAILHLHGGGMVMGSADMARVFAPEIALTHGVVVLSVDYRVAPETAFPGQLDDAEAALRWLLAEADRLRIDPGRLFLMGESAGGGLAAGLAMKLRDTGGPRLAGQILTYPMLDHRTGGPDDPRDHGVAGQFIWTATRNAFGWRALAGAGEIDPAQIAWFSPGLSEDMSGLPSTFLATAALDLFLAENLDFAQRLCAVGIGVELHVYPGAIHGFDLLRRSRLANRYRSHLNEWLDMKLTEPGLAGAGSAI